MEEVIKLIDAVKKKGNLNERAVKVLMEKAQKGQVMEGKNYPACLQGKHLDVNILKKAFVNFKADVDIQKLGL